MSLQKWDLHVLKHLFPCKKPVTFHWLTHSIFFTIYNSGFAYLLLLLVVSCCLFSPVDFSKFQLFFFPYCSLIYKDIYLILFIPMFLPIAFLKIISNPSMSWLFPLPYASGFWFMIYSLLFQMYQFFFFNFIPLLHDLYNFCSLFPTISETIAPLCFMVDPAALASWLALSEHSTDPTLPRPGFPVAIKYQGAHGKTTYCHDP